MCFSTGTRVRDVGGYSLQRPVVAEQQSSKSETDPSHLLVAYITMSALRVLSRASGLRPNRIQPFLQRRGYADAVADKIKLTLSLPHQVRCDLAQAGSSERWSSGSSFAG